MNVSLWLPVGNEHHFRPLAAVAAWYKRLVHCTPDDTRQSKQGLVPVPGERAPMQHPNQTYCMCS